MIAFGSKPLVISPFSTAKLDADEALAGLSPDRTQGTALYDAIVVAAQQLKGNELPGRVIIVLTDGADKGSQRTIEQAYKAALEANAAVYAIGIEGEGFTSDPLVELADRTGGQYYAAHSTASLAAVYAKIAATLKRTWRVQYVTTSRPGDHVNVTASVVGHGSAMSKLAIPGAPPSNPAPSKVVPKGVVRPRRSARRCRCGGLPGPARQSLHARGPARIVGAQPDLGAPRRDARQIQGRAQRAPLGDARATSSS